MEEGRKVRKRKNFNNLDVSCAQAPLSPTPPRAAETLMFFPHILTNSLSPSVLTIWSNSLSPGVPTPISSLIGLFDLMLGFLDSCNLVVPTLPFLLGTLGEQLMHTRVDGTALVEP